MSDTVEAAPAAKVPWHFWLVCVVAVLWNGFGAYDFTMSVTQGEAYFRSMGMTDAQIDYYNAMPSWMYLPWIAGVWGAVAGTILLILRRRWAFHAFVVSLAGLIVSLIYAFFLSNGAQVMGEAMYMQAVILIGCVFFVWYARWATKRGLLR
jgi:hypothetical protein